MACVNLPIGSLLKGASSVTDVWEGLRSAIATQYNGTFLRQPTGVVPNGGYQLTGLLSARSCVENAVKASAATDSFAEVFATIDGIIDLSGNRTTLTQDHINAYLRENGIDPSSAIGQIRTRNQTRSLGQALEVLTFASVENPTQYESVMPTAAFRVFEDKPKDACPEGKVCTTREAIDQQVSDARRAQSEEDARTRPADVPTPQTGEDQGRLSPWIIGGVGLAVGTGLGWIIRRRNELRSKGHGEEATAPTGPAERTMELPVDDAVVEETVVVKKPEVRTGTGGAGTVREPTLVDNGQEVAGTPPKKAVTMRSNAPDPLVGQIFNERYGIEGRLTKGGMARIYKGVQLTTDQEVIIKLLLDSDENPTYLERFKREAKMLAKLSSPHTVRILDFGQDEVSGELFLVMEFIRGKTLDQVLGGKDRKALPARRVLRIARQILESLMEAHNEGIIHRDLKPSNIMLQDGQYHWEDFVRVIDFGIAKDAADKNPLTKQGQAMGTVEYMSPEQIQAKKGEEPDKRSDFYSLGIMMYLMLSGRLPLNGDTQTTKMWAQVHDMPPLLVIADRDGLTDSQVERLVALVHQALEKDQKRRPETADDFIDEIREIEDNPE